MLSEQELDVIQTRADAATPGPWYPFVSPWRDKMRAITVTDHAGLPLAYVGHKDLPNDANLAFIAHSRVDVPALLSECRRLRAALGTVLVAMVEPGLLRTDLDLERVVRTALTGKPTPGSGEVPTGQPSEQSSTEETTR